MNDKTIEYYPLINRWGCRCQTVCNLKWEIDEAQDVSKKLEVFNSRCINCLYLVVKSDAQLRAASPDMYKTLKALILKLKDTELYSSDEVTDAINALRKADGEN